jgi:molecular chaperone GrpE
MMSEPEDEVPATIAPGPPADPIEPEVAFVVPAAAYEAIDTETPRPAPSEPPPGPPPPESPRVLGAIEALGEALGRKLDALQALFEREIRAEATREKVVDRLHAELQEYKQDLILKLLRPIFVDLIQLHDDIGKMIDAQADRDGELGRPLDAMRGVQQGIEDILYRQGVEPFVAESAAFDPRRQRAVATVPTDDPTANKTVAGRHRKGFQAGDKVIRPEIVSVYALRK